jgi:hypothetical protein
MNACRFVARQGPTSQPVLKNDESKILRKSLPGFQTGAGDFSGVLTHKRCFHAGRLPVEKHDRRMTTEQRESEANCSFQSVL